MYLLESPEQTHTGILTRWLMEMTVMIRSFGNLINIFLALPPGLITIMKNLSDGLMIDSPFQSIRSGLQIP